MEFLEIPALTSVRDEQDFVTEAFSESEVAWLIL